MRKAALALIMTGALCACATGPQPEAKLTPKQMAQLDKALDGKVAGEPVSCVSNYGL